MKGILKLFLVFLVFLFANCKEENRLVGDWKLEKIELSDSSEIFGNILGNPIYTFNEDYSYQHRVSGQLEKGTYKMENNHLEIKFEDLDKTTKMNILKLNDTLLIWKIGIENPSIVYLKR